MPKFKGEVMSCLCQSDMERRATIDLLQFKLGLEVTNVDVIGSKQLDYSFCGFIKNIIHKEFLVIINDDWSSIGAVPHLESFYFRSVDRLNVAVFVIRIYTQDSERRLAHDLQELRCLPRHC